MNSQQVQDIRLMYEAVYDNKSQDETVETNQEFDLFDYLLEYLVAEGYADTNQDALVLMANLNQEQINDILTERRREERDEPRRESSPAVQVQKREIRKQQGRPVGQRKRAKGSPVDPDDQPETPVAKFERNRQYQKDASERAQASSRFD